MPSQKLHGLSVHLAGGLDRQLTHICSSCFRATLRQKFCAFSTQRLRVSTTKQSTSSSTGLRRNSRGQVKPWQLDDTFQVSRRSNATYTASIPRSNATSSVTPTPIPTTGVNVPSRLPQPVRVLYDSLRDLESKAANFVNLGRVKLALRSLEGEGLVRIGVLQLKRGNDARSSASIARTLVGALLADVLAKPGAWEDGLRESNPRAILIRYGPDMESTTANSMFRTFYADSPLLKKYNLEILVSTLDIDTTKSTKGSALSSRDDILDSILVPRLETAASAQGGYSSVAYPVHKALVLGESLDDILSFGLFLRAQGLSTIPNDMIKLAINDAHQGESTKPEGRLSVINVQTAVDGIQAFRSSPGGSMEYQHGWDASGLGNLQAWITKGAGSSQKLKAPIKQYITSILEATTERITSAEAEIEQNASRDLTPDTVRSSISQGVDKWAENAHRELQSNLDQAFDSEQWHKLAWWKLPWRVDEVGMIMGDLVERVWLVQAEKGVIFLAGRILEAGLLKRKVWELQEPESKLNKKPIPVLSTTPPSTSSSSSFLLPDTSMKSLYSTSEASTMPAPFKPLDIPYSQHIPIGRHNLLTTTVPPLHALAQSLVMTSFSTTALTAALSALLYVSLPTTSIFEASAIVALGGVFSMRNMQTKWETARETWQADVRENGRRVLMASEGSIRTVVANGGKRSVDDVLSNEVREAKQRVKECWDALSRMGE